MREQLEAVTGERVATLEAVEPERAKGQEGEPEAGRALAKGTEAPEQAREPEPEKPLEPQGVNREFTV